MQEVYINLDDDTFIFQRPYKLNDMELVLVKARIKELLKVRLVELSQGEYALATICLPRNTSLSIRLNVRCVDIIDVSTSVHDMS